jgi:hypothetical protein
MESENHRIAANVIEINQQISSSFRVPVATGHTDHIDEEMQLEISRIFLEKVEFPRPWYSFGIDLWIQAGKWWLQKVTILTCQKLFQSVTIINKRKCRFFDNSRHNLVCEEEQTRSVAELILKRIRTCSKHLGS